MSWHRFLLPDHWWGLLSNGWNSRGSAFWSEKVLLSPPGLRSHLYAWNSRPCLQIHMRSLLKIFAYLPLMLFANPDPPLSPGGVCVLPQVFWTCPWTSVQATFHLLPSQLTLLYLNFHLSRYPFSTQSHTDLSFFCPIGTIEPTSASLGTLHSPMIVSWCYYTPPEKQKVIQGSSTSVCPPTVSGTKVWALKNLLIQFLSHLICKSSAKPSSSPFALQNLF